MSKKQILPMHSVIADYWYGKSITRDGRVVTGDEPDSIPIMVDRYEPSCWGCDRPIVSSMEKKQNVEFEKLWDCSYTTKHIQRCHIVPEMLGGSAKPSNVFLLCKQCHKESPDTTNREAFFRWVYDRRHMYAWGVKQPVLILQDIDAEMKRRDCPTVRELYESLPGEKAETFLDCLTREESRSNMKKRIGMHEFGYNYNSMIIAFADFLLQKYSELLLT